MAGAKNCNSNSRRVLPRFAALTFWRIKFRRSLENCLTSHVSIDGIARCDKNEHTIGSTCPWPISRKNVVNTAGS